MKLAAGLIGLHVAALVLGILGLLIAIPHPELWANNPGAAAFNAWALANTGSLDMITGALAMFAYGAARIGLRRTFSFAVVAVVVSAAAELTGTKTGWPFGGYAYTGFLGARILDRVPYTVPLSWFYMGFASYLLARAIVLRPGVVGRAAEIRAALLGACLLTAWDLVLDPAMASPSLAYMHFWTWQEHGAYFGMPLRNLVGWFGTGLAFIAAGRASFGRGPVPGEHGTPRLAFLLYAVNVVWAMTLAVASGLWPTALAAIALSLLPATRALRNPVGPPPRSAAAGGAA